VALSIFSHSRHRRFGRIGSFPPSGQRILRGELLPSAPFFSQRCGLTTALFPPGSLPRENSILLRTGDALFPPFLPIFKRPRPAAIAFSLIFPALSQNLPPSLSRRHERCFFPEGGAKIWLTICHQAFPYASEGRFSRPFLRRALARCRARWRQMNSLKAWFPPARLFFLPNRTSMPFRQEVASPPVTGTGSRFSPYRGHSPSFPVFSQEPSPLISPNLHAKDLSVAFIEYLTTFRRFPPFLHLPLPNLIHAPSPLDISLLKVLNDKG